MSGDHNMNQTGWRKRQIALDKKAENARELGLDYEPSIIEMARRAGAVFPADGSYHKFERHEDLETFAKLVRADDRDKWMERTVILIRGEREACAKVCEAEADDGTEGEWDECCLGLARAIRARGDKHD